MNVHRAAGATCDGVAMPAVGALVADNALQRAARDHAVDMATYDYFSHTGRDGSMPWQRFAAAGYTGPSPWGENIAAGRSTAAAAVQGWMESPPHCRNIMNADFGRLGVGYAYGPQSTYRHYWVQAFGGR